MNPTGIAPDQHQIGGVGDEGQASSLEHLGLHRAKLHMIISLLQLPAVLLANAGYLCPLVSPLFGQRCIIGFLISDAKPVFLSQSETSVKAPGRA